MQYMMWMKSKQLLNSRFQSSMGSFNTSSSSWEEQAFAEDAAGPLGGFVWPPRSYSCTFCRREFRSAQALGGHMNVHRRDRARLKQSLCSDQTPSSAPEIQQSLQAGDSSSPFSSVSRASATVISQETSSEEAYVSPFSSSITKEQQRLFPYLSSPDSRNGIRKGARKEELLVLDRRDHAAVETNLSVGINSHNTQGSSLHNEEMAINSKRVRSNASFPVYHKPCSSDRFPFQYEMLRMKMSRASSIEDIDLELRLGVPPAVK